jgi:UDP-3-O-[3-hydroxymyristoyl] glucosamine N-acyltransferase
MSDKATTAADLAAMVNGTVLGDSAISLLGFGPLETATPEQISFLGDLKMQAALDASQAGAVLVPMGFSPTVERTVIKVKDPYLASAIIHNYFLAKSFQAEGVHPRAHIGEYCWLGEEITVGPLVVIGSRVKIGERVRIDAGTVIGDDVTIGDDSHIYPNVTIAEKCRLGRRVIIHSGTVIGCDGYGYATNEKGEHLKRPQVGTVTIEDDVEIGANCCVDRAAYGVTLIKRGAKIDNLVQIAHNVVVGEHSLLVAQVGIAGSTTLGHHVVMGGQAGIAGHLHIGDQVMVAAKGGVHTDLEKGAKVGGTPSLDVRQWAKCSAVYSKLPELQKNVRANSRQLEELQKFIADLRKGE